MRKLLACCMFIWAAINANAQYVMNGDAILISGTEYSLTRETTSQGGSVWYQVRLDLRYDFEINAELNLGRLDGPGADGIAFVLQPLSSDLGGEGGGIGYFGISPSLAVEFDTWQNPDRLDPPQDHLAFMHNGNITHSGSNLPYYTLGNIEDGTFQNATFSWNATTHTMTVNYRGFVYVLNEDIVNTIFGGNPYVYWGFTAATGAAINDHRVRFGTTTFIEEINITGNVTDNSCGSTSNGAVDITVTGGKIPYTYMWSNGAVDEDISGVASGSYTVTVTDASGVSKEKTFNVGNIPDNTPPQMNCAGTTMNECFNPTGNYTIAQPVPSDNCGIASASFTISGATVRSGSGLDASGNFNPGSSTITYTVTDASGNSTSCSTTIVVNAALSGTIPDVYAVNPGGVANTIYIGYGPSSVTLTATPSGGTGPYSFVWSTGATSPSITVSPSTPGSYIYTVTITDAAGCKTTITKTVNVVDVRCGHKLDKVVVCHVPPGNPGNAHDICISPNAVETHLTLHGDMLGTCSTGVNEKAKSRNRIEEETSVMNVQPNPSRGQFELRLNSKGEKADISVFNANGTMVQRKSLQVTGREPVRFDLRNEAAGLYIIKVNINGEVRTLRVVVQK